MNKQPSSWQREGIACCLMGIAANFLMFIAKFIAGNISNSVAVKADSVHNLTDSFSCIIGLVGFISKNKSSERIAGMIISVLLFITGSQLMISSAMKFISYSAPLFSFTTLIILCIAFIVKLLSALIFLHKNKRIKSSALRAMGTDCLCDSASTLVSLFSMLVSALTNLKTDALGGIAVAIFIIFVSAKSFFDIKNLKI